MAKAHPDLFEIKKSIYERHNDAVFLKDSALSDEGVADTARASNGEIGHVHGDGSVHLYVAPGDAKIAIERGWAERHRLATPQDSKMFGITIASTYLLFSGPRDDEEMNVMKTFLEAGLRFMSGKQVSL